MSVPSIKPATLMAYNLALASLVLGFAAWLGDSQITSLIVGAVLTHFVKEAVSMHELVSKDAAVERKIVANGHVKENAS